MPLSIDPPSPCTPGATYAVQVKCNETGGWAVLYALEEDAGGVEGLRAAPKVLVNRPAAGAGCGGGCGCDPAALVRLGAEIYKQGLEDGRKGG